MFIYSYTDTEISKNVLIKQDPKEIQIMPNSKRETMFDLIELHFGPF